MMFLKYVLIRVFLVAHWRGTCHEYFFILGNGAWRVVVGRCGLLNLSLARGVVGEVLWERVAESKIYVLRADFMGNGVFKNGSSQLQH
jgi:hypothetical protein